jgi:hypothetical protein
VSRPISTAKASSLSVRFKQHQDGSGYRQDDFQLMSPYQLQWNSSLLSAKLSFNFTTARRKYQSDGNENEAAI